MAADRDTTKAIPTEFIYQISALIISILVVHIIYLSIIRPNADAILEERAQAMESGSAVDTDRSLFVVLRDYEQESCFILFFWAFAMMGLKARDISRQRSFQDRELITLGQGMSILPEDARLYCRGVESLSLEEQKFVIPKALLAALNRFASTGNIQDVSEAIQGVCNTESERLDSELSMIRYIAWAIPSIGFIGTVRGIGDALGQAYKAVEGDIAGVTASLGVAFNSTFIALVISILLMFLMHQLQLYQERLILETNDYCDQNLLRHLRMKKVE